MDLRLPPHLNLYELMIDAGCEPDDPAVRLGVLCRAWFEHKPRCIMILRGEPAVSRRFALSEKPIIG